MRRATPTSFAPPSPGSQSGRFWQFVQARYPLLDPRRSVPRGIGIGIRRRGRVLGRDDGAADPLGLVDLAAGRRRHDRRRGLCDGVFPDRARWPNSPGNSPRPSTRSCGSPAPASRPWRRSRSITEDSQPPIKPILGNLCDGLLGGLDADTALRTAAARVRLAEFTLFTSVIRLQRRSGGSISAAFANLSPDPARTPQHRPEGARRHRADQADPAGAVGDAGAGSDRAEIRRAEIGRNAVRHRTGKQACSTGGSA